MNNLSKLTATLVVIVAILGCAAVLSDESDAAASTVYVGGDGASDETGDGTQSAPYSSITKAVSATSSGGTVVLLGDVDSTKFMIEKTRLTIDLGGNTLTIKGNSTSPGISFFGSSFEIKNGAIIDARDTERSGGYTAISLGAAQKLTVEDVEVKIYDSLNTSSLNNTAYLANAGSTLTLIDSKITSVSESDADSGSIGVVVLGTGNMTKTTSLSLCGTTSITVGQFGISGNGSIVNEDGTSSGGDDTGVSVSTGKDYRGTTISIEDNAVVEAKNGWGIYHPQDGTLIVSDDAIVSGLTGIEMRSGTLELNGGIVKSTAVSTVGNANGNGPTTTGAAIAIVQHATKLDIDVGIHSGAKVSGPTAVYQKDLQNNGSDGTSLISISIDGGDIVSTASGVDNKAVDVENVTEFIIGGHFTGSVSENAMESGYKLSEDGSVQAEDPVASVGNRTFATLEDAINQLENGDTLLLLKDVKVDYVPGEDGYAVPVFTIDVDVTINLSGHSITWKSPVDYELEYTPILFTFTGCTVTITGNGSIDAELGTTSSYGINLMSNANLTIENGSFKGAPTAIQVQSGSLTILDGTFDLSATVKSQAADSMAKYIINCIDASYKDGSADVLIEGGNFGYNFDNNPEGEGTSYCSPGYKMAENSDGTYSASVITADEAYFQVGELYFMDIDSALDYLGSEGVVILLKDTTESSSIYIKDKITIDLNGNDITFASSVDKGLIVEGELTIQDSSCIVPPAVSDDYETVTYDVGTITLSSGSVAVQAQNGGKVILKSGHIESGGSFGISVIGDTTGAVEIASTAIVEGGYVSCQEYGMTAQGNGATITVEGGVIVSRDNNGIGGNGSEGRGGTTINVNGGIIIGHITTSGYNACGIYHPQEGILNITGGTIYADNGVGVLVRAGTANITGGTIISTGNATAHVGDSTITVPAGAVVLDSKSAYPGIGADFVVNITAGSFTADEGVDVIAQVAPDGSDETLIVISGGEFSQRIDDRFLASGVILEGNDEDGYGVVESVTVTFDMPGGTEDVTRTIVKGATVVDLPQAPAGYAASFTSNGSVWDPTAPVETSITVIVTYVLNAPELSIVSVVEGTDATITVTSTSEAQSVSYAYAVVGPDGVSFTLTGKTFTTQYPGTYTVTVKATGEYGNAEATGAVDVTFETQDMEANEVFVDVDYGSESASVTIDGIDLEIAGASYGNVHVVIEEVDSVEIDGHGVSDLTYEITVAGSGINDDEIITITVPIDVPVGQRIASDSAVVLFVPTEGDAEDMDAYIGDDGKSIVFTTTHNSKYAVFYDLEAIPEDDPSFNPYPGDDDDYVPLPPTIVYEDDGSDSTASIAACAAAAVVAAILAIVLASTYRRK